jgi:hypothetical protein
VAAKRIRPADADECRTTWAVIEDAWAQTLAAAQGLPAELHHERVRGEWSFIETLRHLLFVTDAWGSRALEGAAAPYHRLDLPPTGMRNDAVPNDLTARPSLDELLAPRAERLAVVRRVMAGLTDEALARGTVRVHGPGYPRAGVVPVRRCVEALLNEHAQHRQYAERDLARLGR